MIKLCIALHFLAGGSYLDISFAYDVPHNMVHFYAWQALDAIDHSWDLLSHNYSHFDMQYCPDHAVHHMAHVEYLYRRNTYGSYQHN
jgi:hypothetical protein